MQGEKIGALYEKLLGLSLLLSIFYSVDCFCMDRIPLSSGTVGQNEAI
jgi:hypothetical protein